MNSPRRKPLMTAAVRRTIIVAAFLGMVGSIFVLIILSILRPSKVSSALQWHEDLLLQSTKIDPDWLEMEEYYGKIIDRKAASAHRERCKAVLQGLDGFGIARQDLLLFHKFFRPLFEPGVYLQISNGRTGSDGSSTFFFDVCLGWKGVVVEADPVAQRSYSRPRTARLLSTCISSRTKTGSMIGKLTGSSEASSSTTNNCTPFEAVLANNQDILGLRDWDGKWAEKVTFVVIDLPEDELVNFLTCINIRGLLSIGPRIQVWTIRTNQLSGPQLRAVDGAMLLNGFVKVAPNLSNDRTFFEDIYVYMPNAAGNTKFYLPQHQCPNGVTFCPFSEIMKSNNMGKNALSIKCD